MANDRWYDYVKATENARYKPSTLQALFEYDNYKRMCDYYKDDTNWADDMIRHRQEDLAAKEESEKKHQSEQEKQQAEIIRKKQIIKASIIDFLEIISVKLGSKSTFDSLPRPYIKGIQGHEIKGLGKYDIEGLKESELAGFEPYYRISYYEETISEINNTLINDFKSLAKSLKNISDNIPTTFNIDPIIINNQYKITKKTNKFGTAYNIYEKRKLLIRYIQCSETTEKQEPTYHYSIKGKLFTVRFNVTAGNIEEICFLRNKKIDEDLTLPAEIKLNKYGICEFKYKSFSEYSTLAYSDIINIYKTRIYHFRRFLTALRSKKKHFTDDYESKYWDLSNSFQTYQLNEFERMMGILHKIEKFELQPYDNPGNFESLLSTWVYDNMRVLGKVAYQERIYDKSYIITNSIKSLENLLTQPIQDTATISAVPHTSSISSVDSPSLD